MTVSPLLQAKEDARTYTETNEFKIWNLTILWLQSLVTARTDNISVLLKKNVLPSQYMLLASR